MIPRLVGFLLVLIGGSPMLWAAQPVGLLLLEEGSVQLLRGEQPHLLYKNGQSLRLQEGDRIITGAASRARVSFIAAGEEIMLFSKTHLDLSGPDPTGTRRRLRLPKGKARIRVDRTQGQLTLTCLTTLVTVQKAELVVESEEGSVRVSLFQGRAEVSNLAYPEELRRLKAGRWTQVNRMSPPDPPRSLNPAAKLDLLSKESGQLVEGLPPLQPAEVRHENLPEVRHENLRPLTR
ncbi:MAG: FecR domain-containing protein [bacterium]|nr:FecR domain-containing protein [bacterium]